jgi:hypothetical protein
MFLGLLEARAVNPASVMLVDSDDLLHRGIVDYVVNNSDVHAFILNKGYRHSLDQRDLRKSWKFHNICGTSAIYPFPLAQVSENSKLDDYTSCLLTRHHHPSSVDKTFKKLGIPFKYVPFYAAIYTRGYGGSLRDTSDEEPRRETGQVARSYSSLFTRKRLVDTAWKAYGRMLGSQPITDEIEANFIGLSDKLMWATASGRDLAGEPGR